MSIVLAYPTLVAPTTEITLPDIEQLPSSRPVCKFQSVFETDAGETVVYDLGDNRSVFSLNLYPLSQSQADAIKAFYETIVNGQAISWQLRDSLGREYTVRFAQDVIEPVQQGVNAYALSITVRVI
ncbi:hypothetical protein [Solemya velesiana gill symbiont]|uniref:Uncharacterized protein n=1 Tax=Solemya velesiana gill symbiont TaxID=1918948 RepID=A0A1T2KX57_9GAMM|nr:hypothetical protein [Solemya velesiana gill symbiont]OOZ37447.1 hypothetical protein BOW51_02580 [Solemya velesiana gill symbiont]